MLTRFTSASANKHLRRLQEEKQRILADEHDFCAYVRAIGEDEDPPEYDYEQTRARIAEIDHEALVVRHALHLSNAKTLLPENAITIDEALIRMAQLSAEIERLSELRRRRPKARNGHRLFSGDSNVIEYTYANYDVCQADTDFLEASDKLMALQLELDLVNQTSTFEVEL